MLPMLHFVATESQNIVSIQGVKRSHRLPPPSEDRFTVAKGFDFTSEAHVLTDLSPTLQTYLPIYQTSYLRVKRNLPIMRKIF